MSDLNESFLEAYAARVDGERRALEVGRPPTILRIADVLVLRADGERCGESLEDEQRRVLQDACHVPALMATLVGPPDAETLRQLRRDVGAFRDRAPEGPARMLLQLCEAALHPATWTDAGWRDFRDRVRAPIDACIERAAVLETRRLDAATQRHLRVLGARASSAFFVVCAGHQPRYRELTKQYFAALLAEDPGPGAHEERRLLYAENCDDEIEALDLLARQLVDRSLGKRLWQDPFVMQSDLLGGAAARAVAALRGKARAPGPVGRS